jgi:hypothetical protein
LHFSRIPDSGTDDASLRVPYRRIRQPELRVIQNIELLRPEFQREAFVDTKVLEQ